MNNKCALVTGGSRGIGRAIAMQLSEDFSLHILINYSKNKTAALETLNQIKNNGGSAEIIQFNVQNQEEVSDSLSLWEKENKDSEISVLINNAGVTRDNLFLWMKKDEWKEVIDVTLQGFYNVTKFILPKLLKLKDGRIINIASISGLKGNLGQTNYSAAKGGLIAATKALAQEVARRGITVNAVAPGLINTEMTKDLPINELKKIIPLRRFGEIEEVAYLVSFLASQKAKYITGEVININGGLYS